MKSPAKPVSVVKSSNHLIVSEGSGGTASGIIDYAQVLWRRKSSIIFATLLCSGIAMTIAVFALPRYVATAVLEIQDYNQHFLNQGDLEPINSSLPIAADIYLQTQLSVLTSDTLAQRVIRRLGLHQKQSFLEQGTGCAEKMVRSLGLYDRMAALDKPNQPSFVRRLLNIPRTENAYDLDRAAQILETNLKVTAQPQSRIVHVAYVSPDPQMAAAVSNAITEEFISSNLENRWTATERTGRWLHEQMTSFRKDLERNQRALQDYAKSAGVVIFADKTNAAQEKLRQIQADLTKAQSDRAAREADLQISLSASPGTLASVLDNPLIRDHSARLAMLKQKAAETKAIFAPEYSENKRIQAQAVELDQIISKEWANLKQRVRNDYDTAAKRESLLSQSFEKQSQVVSEEATKSVRYDMLKRELDAESSFYDDMVRKLKTADISAAVHAANVRIVDPATAPVMPQKPNIQLLLAAGLVGGMLLGVVYAFSVERLERLKCQVPGDAFAILQIPELGAIPQARHVGRLARPQLTLLESDRERQSRPELSLFSSEPSLLSEAYRSVAASILIHSGIKPQVYVIVSADPQEGKTTTAANVAWRLAEQGRRVLLIDADLRQPRLHKLLGISNSTGLTTLLTGDEQFDDLVLKTVLHQTPAPDLYFLPSGPLVRSSARVLTSPRVAALLSRLKSQFDVILIDTPPAALFADARLMSKSADGVIIVVRAGRSDTDRLSRVCDRFRDDGVPITGIVLNAWSPDHATEYEKAYSTYLNSSVT